MVGVGKGRGNCHIECYSFTTDMWLDLRSQGVNTEQACLFMAYGGKLGYNLEIDNNKSWWIHVPTQSAFVKAYSYFSPKPQVLPWFSRISLSSISMSHPNHQNNQNKNIGYIN